MTMQNEEQKMYRFKKWTSDEERAEVMKIIKYQQNGLVNGESLAAHPELKGYFEPVEQNEPQLSAELKAKYNDLRPHIKSGVVQEKIDEVFNWFATALEEQRKEYEELIYDLADDGDCWFDHHGFCQEHSWFAVEPECPHARAKSILKLKDV